MLAQPNAAITGTQSGAFLRIQWRVATCANNAELWVSGTLHCYALSGNIVQYFCTINGLYSHVNRKHQRS
jgi:hypothetical protein